MRPSSAAPPQSSSARSPATRPRPSSAVPSPQGRSDVTVPVDAAAHWPLSLREIVQRQPTMDDDMEEHKAFVGESAHRRAAVEGIVAAVEGWRLGAARQRQIEGARARRRRSQELCRTLVHGAHSKPGGLGLGRASVERLHRRQHGPTLRRPWSASAVDRSRTGLNLRPGPSSQPAPPSCLVGDGAGDLLLEAIEARRQRQSWWRAGLEVEVGALHPDVAGAVDADLGAVVAVPSCGVGLGWGWATELQAGLAWLQRTTHIGCASAVGCTVRPLG
jgi:hypothetical protein|eukprot:SAG25_NODE_173_length_12920_cov_18.688168_12_plen_275_part_00